MTKKLFILLAAVSLMWGCCPCRNLITETDRQDSTRGVAGVINGVGEVVGNVVEYFR